MTMTSKRIILLAVIIAVAFVLGRLAVREVLNLLLGGTLAALYALGMELFADWKKALCENTEMGIALYCCVSCSVCRLCFTQNEQRPDPRQIQHPLG